MRLFVAIELPPEIKQALVGLKEEIPGASVTGVTWVKPSALHLTLHFLGDGIDPIRLMPIKTALATVKAAPFPLTLSGVGRFPPGVKRPARVLWVGVAEQLALLALQEAVEQALDSVDFPPEDRAFSPHITLARLKSDGQAPLVARFLEQHRAFCTESFTISAFHLVSSVLTPQGPEYRHEASVALKD